MGVLFLRGERIPVDDAAMEAAECARIAYADRYRKEHGELPRAALQYRVWTREYEAVAKRRTMRVVP